MRSILFYVPLFFGFVSLFSNRFEVERREEKARIFKLSFVTVGFGSNMFEMEPVFVVNGTKFTYTSEEVWAWPGQKEFRRDTLLTGNFRVSSIDSILNMVADIKDSVVYRTNIRIRSGSAGYIDITDDKRTIKFQLHNASHPVADKIVEILSSYIPEELDRLYIIQ